MKLNGTACINNLGHLEIGGLDIVKLTKEYGTPLFVYDETFIRKQCRRFHDVLKNSGLAYHISYASKAFLCKEIARIMQQEQMGLDVVSIGELYNALAAGFPAHKIHLHGNNKTEEEITYALENEIGCFVVDSFDEIERLNRLAGKFGKNPHCLLRINPGVEAHTHEFITTGNVDSKFGLNIENGQATFGVEALLSAEHLHLKGLHFHIGSQIFGTEGTRHAIEKTFRFLNTLRSRYAFRCNVLNIGGGFGIRYTDEDTSYPIEQALTEIIGALKNAASVNNLSIPELWLEPGRSIVGEAGYTIYTIGTIKKIPDVRTYISIDGGMSDHIRTALYDAKYEVALANRMHDPCDSLMTIAGKCCESGDIIARDVSLPTPKVGDLAVVSATGAYHYSMSSNYNHMQKPAVLFVSEGHVRVAIKRESLGDLIKNQL